MGFALLLGGVPRGAAEPASATPAIDRRAYLAEISARARALHLASDPRWLALVHYERRTLLPGVRSDALGSEFYLAPKGRSDPEAELLATLTAFLDPQATRKGEPVRCAYPARFQWLDLRLGFDPAELAPASCTGYAEWRRGLGGAAVSLVFPEAFMGSPASMFGHTLLRIDTTAEESPRNLAAYVLDFTADTGGEAGPIYLLKGLLGRYPAYFGVQPYYAKTWLYADWQNRDIWEYRLALSADEIDLLLMHLWELRAIFFPYWFFDENCSWRLLRLLETARPELRLSQGFGPVVLPVDTVRRVVAEPGLVERVHYRPSAVTEIRARQRALSPRARSALYRVAAGELEPGAPELAALDARERAIALSLAYDTLRFRLLAGEVTEEVARERGRRILLARSQLGSVSGAAPLFPPLPEPALRPDTGHPTARASLAGGVSNGQAFTEARLRWALHDLMDPEGGYPYGTQVDFLDARLRWFPGTGSVRLDQAVLLDVRSLAPRDELASPLSWRFDVGMRTRLFDASGADLGEPHAVGRAAGGVGLSFEPAPWLTAYGFAEATLDGAPALEHGVALGPGAVAGVYLSPASDRWKGHVFARARGFVVGDRTLALTLGTEQRWTLGPRQALQLDAAWQRDFGHAWLETSLAWHFYF